MLAGTVVGMLAFHEPNPSAVTNPTPVVLPTDSIPHPDSAPRLRQKAVDASARFPQRRRHTCRVTIEGPNKDGLFLVLFDAESGARLTAKPVVAPFPLEITLEGIPIGDHHVRLARDANRARTHYVSSALVSINDHDGARVKLSTTVQDLSIKLAPSQPNKPGDRRASIADIPVLLRREDDPNWRYADPDPERASGHMATNEKGLVVFRGLGKGTYVLSTPGFEPEAAERPRLKFQLGEFDSAKPIRGRAY